MPFWRRFNSRLRYIEGKRCVSISSLWNVHRLAGMQLHELSDNYASCVAHLLQVEICGDSYATREEHSRGTFRVPSLPRRVLILRARIAHISPSRFFFLFHRAATFGGFSWRRRIRSVPKKQSTACPRKVDEATKVEGLARTVLIGQWNDGSAIHRGQTASPAQSNSLLRSWGAL